MQICPMLGFPFAMPSTNHETLASGLPDTFAVSETRWYAAAVAADGEIARDTLLVIVTEAEAVLEPAVTALAVAWIVAAVASGRAAGAE